MINCFAILIALLPLSHLVVSGNSHKLKPWWNIQQVQDFMCICRNFQTPVTKWSISTTDCTHNAFANRWNPIHKNEFIVNGLHALIYKSLPDNVIVIAFRHQEGEGLLDSDMWEAMALFGRNYVQLSTGWASTGSVLAYFCNILQKSIFYTRRFLLKHDYYSSAISIVEKVRQRYPRSRQIFTGYSIGGVIAQLMAIQYGSHAIVFASNGVEDIVKDLYNEMFSSKIKSFHVNKDKIFNFMHERDIIPSMDCQVGIVCDIPSRFHPETDPHEKYIYGDVGWSDLLRIKNGTILIDDVCTSGENWSTAHGFCDAKDENLGQTKYALYSIILVIMLLRAVIKKLLCSDKSKKE